MAFQFRAVTGELTMIDGAKERVYIPPMNPNNNDPLSQFDNVANRASEGIMYAGAVGTGLAWALSVEGIVALSGLFIAVVGFFVNCYFSFRRDKRQQELHDLQVKALEEKNDG